MQVLKTHENVYIIDGRLFSQGLSLHYHQDRHYQEQTSGGRGGPHAACIICGGTWFFGLGIVAWELEFGNLSLGTLVWEL